MCPGIFASYAVVNRLSIVKKYPGRGNVQVWGVGGINHWFYSCNKFLLITNVLIPRNVLKLMSAAKLMFSSNFLPNVDEIPVILLWTFEYLWYRLHKVFTSGPKNWIQTCHWWSLFHFDQKTQTYCPWPQLLGSCNMLVACHLTVAPKMIQPC